MYDVFSFNVFEEKNIKRNLKIESIHRFRDKHNKQKYLINFNSF